MLSLLTRMQIRIEWVVGVTSWWKLEQGRKKKITLKTFGAKTTTKTNIVEMRANTWRQTGRRKAGRVQLHQLAPKTPCTNTYCKNDKIVCQFEQINFTTYFMTYFNLYKLIWQKKVPPHQLGLWFIIFLDKYTLGVFL